MLCLYKQQDENSGIVQPLIYDKQSKEVTSKLLSVNEIKSFIENDRTSNKKMFACVGERYYNADHDIMKSRMFYYNNDGKLVEDTLRANIKISHPFFTELTDQFVSYLLSGNENPIRAKETAEGLQEQLDKYFDDEFWAETSEVVSGAYVKGFDYLFAYRTDEHLKFSAADSLGVVEVDSKETKDKKKYVIYWYIDYINRKNQRIKRIQVWDEKETRYFKQVNDGEIIKDEDRDINPRPHIVYTDDRTGKKYGQGFGFIPFFRLDNNNKQISGLKPIKKLIDDYDLMECGLSNNLTDFDTPLYVVSGFQGDSLDELQQNLKTKKIIGTDSDGGVSIQTVDIPYEARKVKADEDEKNIYRFGMGLNTYGLKDTSATTNIAIKAAYSLLDLKANKMELRLKKFLKPIIEIVLTEINAANKTDYKYTDVYFDFKRNIMLNESENAQIEKTKADTRLVEINTILNIAAQVGDEQTLKAICEAMDYDYDRVQDLIRKAAENSLDGAQNRLDEAVTE